MSVHHRLSIQKAIAKLASFIKSVTNSLLINIRFDTSVDIVREPTTYGGAMNSEQKEDRIKWKNTINKELKEMDKRGVWEIIDEKDIPINCRCIKN
jgi:rRNA pseudouridine-1189 N-methylase Emg1 (Nep1/Mra1 family)